MNIHGGNEEIDSVSFAESVSSVMILFKGLQVFPTSQGQNKDMHFYGTSCFNCKGANVFLLS